MTTGFSLFAATLLAVQALTAQGEHQPSPAHSAGAAVDPKLLQRAREIQSRIIAFDSHVDLPFDYAGAAIDGKAQIDLPKVQRGGLKGTALAVFVQQGPRTPEGYAKARLDAEKKFKLIKAFAEQNSDRAVLAYSPADVRRAAAKGRFAVVISMLNAYPLGSDLSQIDEWYKRGVRVFGYVHAGHNDWADSSRPSRALGNAEQEHGGLSEIGKQGIARLNALGMLIDVSQLSTPAFQQVLSLTKAPVVATHSGIRSIVENTRNLSDEELELLRKNGGVVQVVAFSNYVRQMPKSITDRIAALQNEYGFQNGNVPEGFSESKRKEYTERNQQIVASAPRGTVAELVDSISYAVKKIGVNHVGIASDFNHGGGVEGWDDEGECLNVTAELLRRGYSEGEIAKLWGGNFLRAWGEAQKAAAKIVP